VVLQNYMFERFLERLSVSDYSEKFVVKGGMLIADVKEIIKQISSSADLNDMWVKYQKKFTYAKEIAFDKILGVLNYLLE